MYETLSIAHKNLNDINPPTKKQQNDEKNSPSNTLINNKIKTNTADNNDIGNKDEKIVFYKQNHLS